jgi:predicted KAP-like P-loop ATPase
MIQRIGGGGPQERIAVLGHVPSSSGSGWLLCFLWSATSAVGSARGGRLSSWLPPGGHNLFLAGGPEPASRRSHMRARECRSDANVARAYTVPRISDSSPNEPPPPDTEAVTRVPVAADNPIRSSTEDRLGRAAAATRFADDVLAVDASEGVVVGVLGAWGSGKTSFVNLGRERLADRGATVIDFNPWMFSGTEQLVTTFFVEVAAQLRLQPGLAEVGKDLEEYGEAFAGLGWLPLVGPWIERGRLANKAISKLLQRRKEGAGARREQVVKALRQLPHPVVVVVDDIDRLSTNEIRDIFKLVRLTASFPNVIYVVAFDRERVEVALTEHGVPGRAYLEKVLQVAVDLPALPERVLTREILEALDDALRGVETARTLDEEAWPDIFIEVIRPLIRNLRDVKRYAAAARSTVRELGDEVQLADLLALEAVRVFLPDVFVRLHASTAALTTPAPGIGLSDRSGLKEQIDDLLAAAGSYDALVRSLIQRVFPAAQRHLPSGQHYGGSWTNQWLRGRRVAHEEILRLYLERVAGEGLRAFRDAERAWELMADEDRLDQYLRSLDPQVVEDVIAALERYEDEYRPEHAVPAITVLLNLLPELPDQPRGMFEMETHFVVGRVVYRLLKALPDAAAVEAAAEAIVPKLESLSSQLELITDIGYRENAGHKLATEAGAARLEAEWRARVREAPPEVLVREHALAPALLVARTDAASAGENEIVVDASPEVTLAVLRTSLTYIRSQSANSRAVRRSPRLPWNSLSDLYGGEDILVARVNALRDAGLPGAGEVLELAERYATGWRPSDFGDQD